MGDVGCPPIATGASGLPSSNPTQSFWQASHPNAVKDHRSTPALPPKASIVVIGTGITGTFAAHELLTNSTSESIPHSPDEVEVLVLEARTLCSAATGRNGGHLQPLIHDQHAGIIDFELANFNHVESLVAQHGIPCDFRRLPGCLGFWNRTYFEEAKAALGSEAICKHREKVRVVEDSGELEKLRLRGAVGAFVQTTAASLSPYKLCVWIWEDLLKKFE